MQDQFQTEPTDTDAEPPVDPASLSECTIVVIRAFDDIPEHLFEITDVYDDCVGGYSRTGRLAGDYGEPELALIKAVHRA